MGWASAGGIFGAMASSLIRAGASEELLASACRDMIDRLRQDDWDTLDESLEQFEDNPVIVRVFGEFGVYPHYSRTPRLADEIVSRIEAQYRATTRGVWSLERGSHVYNMEKEGDDAAYLGMLDGFSEPDAEFMILAHEQTPRLLAEIRRLRARLRQLHGDRDDD